jgi:hypothetical protein
MPALTINAVQTFQNRAVLGVVSKVWDVGQSLPFDSTYLSADSYGNKYLYPGLLVAFNADLTKYVPWNANSSYGAYSAYLEGIIYTFYDFTAQDQVVAPATRCAVVVENAEVYGGTFGEVPMAARTASSIQGVQIQWDD